MNLRDKLRFRPVVEQLEERCMPTSATLLGNVLTVTGTPNPEQIIVRQLSGKIVVQEFTDHPNIFSGAATSVSKIVINAGAGDDQIYIGNLGKDESLIAALVEAYGEAGNDLLANNSGTKCTLNGGGKINDPSPSAVRNRDQFFWDSKVPPTLRDDFDPAQPVFNLATRGDVNQMSSPNCWFMASLAAVAGDGKNDLADRITHVSGNNYQVLLFANGLWSPVSVTFDGSWKPTDAQPPGDANGEYWPILYWKAFQSKVKTTGCDVAFKALTGRDATFYTTKGDVDARRIMAELQRGSYVTFDTLSTNLPTTVLKMVPHHCYTVVSMFVGSDNQFYVKLRNPWGTDGEMSNGKPLPGFNYDANPNDGEFVMKWTDLTKWMAQYWICPRTDSPNAFFVDNAGRIFSADVSTGASRFVGSSGRVLYDIAFAPDGLLYGVDNHGYLCRLTLNWLQTGSIKCEALGTVPIKRTDGKPFFANALEFRPDGTLFAAGYNVLYRINMNTRMADVVATFGDQFQSAGDLVFDPSGNLFLTCLDGNLIRVNASLLKGTGANLANPAAVQTGVRDTFGLILANAKDPLGNGIDPVFYGFSNGQRNIFALDSKTGLKLNRGLTPITDNYPVSGMFGATVFRS